MWGDKMKRNVGFPKKFFSEYREKKVERKNDDYSKIEEIKWNKDVIAGKRKVEGSLPKERKMI